MVAPDAAETNLSRPSRIFVGRTDERERLEQLLDREGTVATIVGPPGVGKTTLARRIAHQLHESTFADRDGTWFCRLHDCESRVDVLDRLSTVLPVHLEASGEVDERIDDLTSWLEGRSLLIVLDNVEHVRDSARTLVSTLLEAGDGVRLLVTSRQTLDHPRERATFLDPLQAEDAVELYLERARARGARSDRFDTEDIERLVERLDAIPLAIELAAAQLPALGPVQLLDRLDEPFALLQVADGDSDTFESPLREAIAGSWSLLNDWQQSILLQCAVFSGSFSMADAEAVVSLEHHDEAPPIPQAINSLARHSLLHVSDDATDERSFALFESVAEFARQKLAETDSTALRRRHLDHLVDRADDLVREWREHGSVQIRTAFDASYREMVDAIAFGLDHAPLQAARLTVSLVKLSTALSPTREIDGLLERAERAVDRLDGGRGEVRIVRARLAAAASSPWYFNKAPISEEVGRNYERALDIVDEDDSPAVRGRIRLEYGAFLSSAGETDRSRPELEQSLELLRPDGRPIDVFDALVALGSTFFLEDRLDRVRDVLGEARQLADRHDLTRAKFVASRSIAGFEASLGHFEVAEVHASDALEHARTIGVDTFITPSLRSLGRYRLALGQLDASREALREGLARAEELSLPIYVGDLHSDLGAIHCLEADYDRAAPHLRKAVQYHRESRVPLREVEALSRLGAVAYLDGRMDEGDAHLETAREVVERTDRPRAGPQLEVVERVRHLGEAIRVFERGDYEGGMELLESVTDFGDTDTPLEQTTNEQTQLALRLLEMGVEIVKRDDAEPIAPSVDPSEALRVADNARWFQPPDAEHVDLSRRSALRRMVWHFARRHDDDPGAETDVFELIDIGWPDEEVTPQSGKARVYNTIGTLRDLGLEGILITGEEGYLLDPEMPVVIVDE